MVNTNQAVVMTAAGLAVIALVVAVVVLTSAQLLTSGTIVTNNPNLKIYADQQCTKEINSVQWGSLYPGGNATVNIIHNTGNVPLTIRMTESNWNPATAKNYLTLSWNQEGTWLSPTSVLPSDLILHASPLVVDVTDFGFQILISGTG